MHVQILATGSSGNSVLVDHSILIDAGISIKAFQSFGLQADDIKALLITHRHGDHMKLPLVRHLLTNGVSAYLPPEVIGELTKEGLIDMTPLLASGQVIPISTETIFHTENVRVDAHPQKHHDLVNYAFTLTKGNDRLLYCTDLDTVEATDMGVGLLHLGMFDTILLEGNYDEPYLREYIEYMISLVPEAEDPRKSSDEALEQWVKLNYRNLPDEIARNAFRAIQNHRHLSKQQARAYASGHLKPGGVYYEIHRSSQFYEKPEGWQGA